MGYWLIGKHCRFVAVLLMHIVLSNSRTLPLTNSISFFMRHTGLYIAVIASVIGLIAITSFVNVESADEILQAALEDFVSHDSFTAYILLETLVSTEVLGISLGENVSPLRMPLGLGGNAEVRYGNDEPFRLYADLGVTTEGEESGEDAIHVEYLSGGHGEGFIRIRNIPVSTSALIRLHKLNDVWRRISADDLAKLTGGDVVVGTVQETEEENRKVTADFSTDILRKLLARGGVFAVAEEIPRGPNDVEQNTHYVLRYDEGAVKEIVAVLVEEFEGEILRDSDKMNILNIFNEFSLHVEVWIDENTKQITKFGYDLRPLPGTLSPPTRVIVEILGYDTKGDIPVLPEDAQSVMEFLEEEIERISSG